MASLTAELDLSKLVFLDETRLSTDMICYYWRALGGARCRDAAPAGYWKTLTFIAGLRIDPHDILVQIGP